MVEVAWSTDTLSCGPFDILAIRPAWKANKSPVPVRIQELLRRREYLVIVHELGVRKRQLSFVKELCAKLP